MSGILPEPEEINPDEDPDWWKPKEPGECWVCSDETEWAYLDLGYQHPDCDAWPGENGINWRKIRGKDPEPWKLDN